jgi:membrane-associated phospholipid phosphatase
MEAIHEFEIVVLLFLQSIGAWLASVMQAASLLGSEEFYMLVMPTVFWSLDSALGIRLAVMLILTNGVSSFGKMAFHLARPYWIDTRIVPLSVETGFGMPSGHAMNAAGLWGLMVVWTRQRWAKAAGLVLIFLIGFSRLYLGMHFISDVLVGWLIGGLMLALFLRLETSITPWLSTLSLRQKIGLAFASSVGIILLFVLGRALAGGWTVPALWAQNALRQGEPIDPFNLDAAFTLAGTWFGMLAGVAWYQQRYGAYSAAGTPAQRLLRYAVGLVGILIFWFGLGKILPREADLLSFTLRYLRYILVGLWISALAPLLFERMGLQRKPMIPAKA